MAAGETNILKRIWVRASKAGFTLFRNNVGLALLPDRAIRYGLHEGSADLIGWETTIITPVHVGQRLAIFTAIEVKTPKGQLSKPQRQWLWQAAAAGCRVFILDSEQYYDNSNNGPGR
jgi:hypothetical protein